MRTVVVSGVTGYFGRALARRLCVDFRVIGLHRLHSDVSYFKSHLPSVELVCIPLDRELAQLRDVMATYPVDVIIHAATCYGRNGESLADVCDANLEFPLQLLDVANQHQASLINIDTILNRHTNAYTLSKKQFVEWLQQVATTQIVNVRLDAFFGANDGGLIDRLISDFLEKKLHISLTQGQQIRNFLFVDDLVDAFSCLVHQLDQIQDRFFELEIGNDTPISIRDLVLLVQQLTGNQTTQLGFGDVAYRRHELMESKLDTSIIRSFGWSPRISLREAVTQLVAEKRGQLCVI